MNTFYKLLSLTQPLMTPRTMQLAVLILAVVAGFVAGGGDTFSPTDLMSGSPGAG